MNVKKWKFYSDEQLQKSRLDQITDEVSLWGTIGLLWFAMIVILKEHFPKWLETTVTTYEPAMGEVDDLISLNPVEVVVHTYTINGWVLFLFVSALCLTGSILFSEKLRKWRFLPYLGAIAIPAGYIFFRWEEVSSGMIALLGQYLDRFNVYQGTAIGHSGGNPGYTPFAATALLMMLWLVVWSWSFLVKRRVLLVLFPLAGTCIELLVGCSPTGIGLGCIFVATVLLLLPKGTKWLRYGMVLGLTVLSLFMVGKVFEEQIDRLAKQDNPFEKIVESIREMEFSEIQIGNVNLADFLNIQIVKKTETLDNEKPLFSGKVVFELSSRQKPVGNLYLRGYIANEYENGTWTWNTEEFQKFCQTYGYDERTAALAIASLPAKVLGFMGANQSTLTIEEKRALSNVTYMPYFFKPATLDSGNYEFVGDYLMQKNWTDRNISMYYVENSFQEVLYQYVAMGQGTAYYDIVHAYNSVAQTYVNGDPNITELVLLAVKLRTQVIDSERDIFRDENRYRYHCAKAVRDYLVSNWTYSVELDELPEGVDPVEYALTVSKEGYCMHYASTAALLLQYMGVPTRYVSGYVARPADFVFDKGQGEFVAQIKDSAAHAWIEIYYDDFGWLPVEVTGGAGAAQPPEPTEAEPSESETDTPVTPPETEPTETEPTESETDTAVTPPESSETETGGGTEPTETEPTESEETETETSPGIRPTEPEDTEEEYVKTPADLWWEQLIRLLKVMEALLIGGLLFLALLWGEKFWIKRYEMALQKHIMANQTGLAIKKMNRRLYYKLRRMRVFGKRHGGVRASATDAEYLVALKENFPEAEADEWERFMEIVKKERYSKETVTNEEMMYCYRIYQRV